jgi:hypothetical protein
VIECVDNLVARSSRVTLAVSYSNHSEAPVKLRSSSDRPIMRPLPMLYILEVDSSSGYKYVCTVVFVHLQALLPGALISTEAPTG